MKGLHGTGREADELVGLLDGLARRFHRHREAAEGVPLTPREFQSIGAIGAGAGGTMSGLARDMGLTVGSLTGVIDRLVGKGLVSRGRDAADRRIVRIALTPSGRRLHGEFLRMRRRMASAMLAPLEPPERVEFMTLMRKIASPVSAMKGTTP